jgi:hypothetical protein
MTHVEVRSIVYSCHLRVRLNNLFCNSKSILEQSERCYEELCRKKSLETGWAARSIVWFVFVPADGYELLSEKFWWNKVRSNI